MSETTAPQTRGSQASLFEYALRLHRLAPDSPLPRDGYPFPDEEAHRRQPDADWRRLGMDVASILDAHFATDASPSVLADAFHDVPVPRHRNEHVAAAALRGDQQRVRDTGRWLVRRAADRCAALVGLALLAADRVDEDIPLIQTIGLLSNEFGPLAAEALRRRRV